MSAENPRTLNYKSIIPEFSSSIDDILADSDSELENDIMMDDESKPEQRPKKKARSRDERYIHEDLDDIVDLADVNAIGKITCKFTRIILAEQRIRIS